MGFLCLLELDPNADTAKTRPPILDIRKTRPEI